MNIHRFTIAIALSVALAGLVHGADQGTGMSFQRMGAAGSATWWYGTEAQPERLLAFKVDASAMTMELVPVTPDAAGTTKAVFDSQGRLTTFVQPGRTLNTSYGTKGVSTKFISASGKTNTLQTAQILLDAGFACWAAGAFDLSRKGQEVIFRASPPQDPSKDLETAEYECYMKVLGTSRETTPAGTFNCLEVEMGFTGVAALFAPKFRVWVDQTSRRMVAFRFNDEKVRSIVVAVD